MTHDADWFDSLYRSQGDPWRYETSAYEARKYARSLSLLRRRRHGSALEIGCSIGVMSGLIAARCDSLLALDFAPAAVDTARARGIANARFEVGAAPEDWPAGAWDLIVLSEVLYYLDPRQIDRLATLVARDLAPGGDCLVVTYSGETDTPLTGPEAGRRFLGALGAARPRHVTAVQREESWIATAFGCRAAQAAPGVQGRNR